MFEKLKLIKKLKSGDLTVHEVVEILTNFIEHSSAQEQHSLVIDIFNNHRFRKHPRLDASDGAIYYIENETFYLNCWAWNVINNADAHSVKLFFKFISSLYRDFVIFASGCGMSVKLSSKKNKDIEYIYLNKKDNILGINMLANDKTIPADSINQKVLFYDGIIKTIPILEIKQKINDNPSDYVRVPSADFYLALKVKIL